MQTIEIVLVGSKPVTSEIDGVIDQFQHIARFNFAMPGLNNSGNQSTHHGLNPHTKRVLSKPSFNQLCGWYQFIPANHLKQFLDWFNKKRPELTIYTRTHHIANSNNYLEQIGCPIRFTKAPRIGYDFLIDVLKKGHRVYVSHFDIGSITQAFYHPRNLQLHDENSEIAILQWLHKHNKVDATLCTVTASPFPITLDASIIKPTTNVLLRILRQHGIVLITNYYTPDNLNKIVTDAKNMVKTHSKQLECSEKEGLSNDKRLFHAERYSSAVANFTNNSTFGEVAKTYMGCGLRKKALVNQLTHEPNVTKNSGGGWHRDSHNMQFKTIMYLTDVTPQTGCFQFLTKSSTKHIGKPTPRTANYNTRFADETVNKLIDNEKIKKYDICGPAGTIMIVDTTYIHRGAPIQNGERWALTIYYH